MRELFGHPQHPYIKGLVSCIPVRGKTVPGQLLQAIPGVIPSLIGSQKSCAFRNCSPSAQACCSENPPYLAVTLQQCVHCIQAQA
ncbi:MAG: oligopeptide/dipeptide ABC transporter ATP-binding protein [Candidatus Malihini olakiniferum]